MYINIKSIEEKAGKAAKKRAASGGAQSQISDEKAIAVAKEAGEVFKRTLQSALDKVDARKSGTLVSGGNGTIGWDSDIVDVLKDISVDTPTIISTVDNEGATHKVVSVGVNFNRSLRRPSLYPSGYPKGAYNIATLLNSGWDYNTQTGRVFAEWHGYQTAGLKGRHGAHYIEDSIRMFTDKYSNKYGVTDIRQLFDGRN